MELRLQKHLAKLFNEQRKGQGAKDVQRNPRAMAKLLREANRLKTILSANADHMAQVPANPRVSLGGLSKASTLHSFLPLVARLPGQSMSLDWTCAVLVFSDPTLLNSSPPSPLSPFPALPNPEKSP